MSVFWVILVRIQYKCGKLRTRITPNTDTFYAVTRVRSHNQEFSSPKITSHVGSISPKIISHLINFFLIFTVDTHLPPSISYLQLKFYRRIDVSFVQLLLWVFFCSWISLYMIGVTLFCISLHFNWWWCWWGSLRSRDRHIHNNPFKRSFLSLCLSHLYYYPILKIVTTRDLFKIHQPCNFEYKYNLAPGPFPKQKLYQS